MARVKTILFSDRIYRELGARIAKGEFDKGALLPSERDLAAQYDASRPTIRRVLARLSLDGLLESQPGIGYRVVATKASQPAAGASRLIGLLVDNTDTPHSVGMRLLEKLLTAQGYSLLLGFSDLEVEKENDCLRRFLGVGAGGFIVIPAIRGGKHAQLGDLIKRNFPIVALGEPRAWCVGMRLSGMVSAVDVDNTTAMMLNLSHLHELGHRRIGLVMATHVQGITTIRQRAYAAFAQEQQLKTRPEWLVHADPSIAHSGEEALLHLLAARDAAPTAFVCQTNALARHVVGLLSSAGIRVPADVSVTGFGPLESGEQHVTHVAYSGEAYAAEVVRLLVAQMGGETVHHKSLVLPELREGHTAAVPRARAGKPVSPTKRPPGFLPR